MGSTAGIEAVADEVRLLTRQNGTKFATAYTARGASRQAATVFKSYRHSPRDMAHQRGLEGGLGRTDVSRPSRHATTDCFLAVVEKVSTRNLLLVSPRASISSGSCSRVGQLLGSYLPVFVFFIYLFFTHFLI